MIRDLAMDVETQIARRIVQRIDHDSQPLPDGVQLRLQQSRQMALERQRRTAAGLSIAGIGREISDFWFAHGRSVAMALMLLATLATADYWHEANQSSELEEVDSALLSDDLPIDAYLDHGFDQWLKRDAGDDS